jgi:hypothetical protein
MEGHTRRADTTAFQRFRKCDSEYSKNPKRRNTKLSPATSYRKDRSIMTSTNKCGFNEAWIGVCNEPNPCKKHSDLKCVSCGNKATRTCDETGQFVCGAPLCDDCEHTIAEDGTNGGIGFYKTSNFAGLKEHCRKTEQVNKPWFERD